MSAAVATRSQQQNPPHPTNARMAPKSPADKKKSLTKSEDPSNKDSSPPSSRSTEKKTSSRPGSSTKSKLDDVSTTESTGPSNAETSQPLAPPPRPAAQNPSDPDYFGTAANNGSHLSLEPNPFEQSFGNPSVETPGGKNLLPPVASLTSPASLLQDGSSASFNWKTSLRSGPLSPAMLTGPTGTSDYFDAAHLRGGFPTPNESSLRTGLTPGGGGSMFPAPSPNTQAIFNQIASAGATPGTLEFQRTAMNVAASRNAEAGTRAALAQAVDQDAQESLDSSRIQQPQPPAPLAQPTQSVADPFGQHDANDAANGLFLLAQARNGPQQANQFVSNSQSNGFAPPPAAPGAGPVPAPHQTSPVMGKRTARNAGSLGGSISDSVRGASEMSGEFSESGASEQAKSGTRGKGKKSGSSAKTGPASGSRRKATDTPSKTPSKKAKGNSGSAMPDFGPESDEEVDMKEDQYNENGKKMTDEEKRKNFLERNRVAALKCRQRKKQWLANLQAKVEIYSSENDALSAQVTQLREEIVNLKTLLLAHKDCPVSQTQGMGGLPMNPMAGAYTHDNPYGMALANGQVMAGQGMQRRY